MHALLEQISLEHPMRNENSLERWIAFGNEVVRRREWLTRQRGYKATQKAIAKAAGISEKHISRIETAVSGTEYTTVLALAKALEYTEEERPAFFALAHMAYESEMPALPEGFPLRGVDRVTIQQNGKTYEVDKSGKVVPASLATKADMDRLEAKIDELLRTYGRHISKE